LDNTHLWISRARNPKPFQVNDALVVLNPFTKEQQELPADFPDFSSDVLDPGLGWNGFFWSLLVFDPTLSEVLYPVNGYNLALRDITHNETLALITGTASVNVTPNWSPDGQQVLIGGPSDMSSGHIYTNTQPAVMDLFRITRQGEFDQLTHLADVYTNADFGNYTWAPDGRSIALPLHAEPIDYPDLYSVTQQQATNRLTVLELATRVITNYCVPDTTLAPPVWSPDGHYLVFEDPRYTTENDEFVVDLVNDIAYSLTETATPIGWMTSSP
jgi:Tol biopolymer transport system component